MDRIITVIATIMLLYVLLVTSFQAVAYWLPGWFRYEYDKQNSVHYITGEMSLDDIVYVSDCVMDYCKGDMDKLDDVKATIDGEEVYFFTDRELAHLKDCRNLITGIFELRTIALVVLLISIAVLFLRKAAVKKVARSCFLTTSVSAIAVIIIGIIAATNFDPLFIKFHEIFFDNDLWILNPREDNLLNIMQEGMFQDTALLIFGIWAICLAIILVVSRRKSRS